MHQKEKELADAIDQLKRPIERYFAVRGFPSEECRDLAQETFLQAVKGLALFRGDAQMKTWIYRIAENVALKSVRRSQALKRQGREFSFEALKDAGERLPTEKGNSPRSHPTGPLADLLGQEERDKIVQAIGALPPQMKRCLMLYTHQHRSYQEIADLMQVSINTVKSQIHQGRQRLKDTLGDYYGFRP